MGLWNASTAVGNLVGGYIAGMFKEILSFDGTKYNQASNWICNQQWNYTPGAFVDDDWGLSFVIPGIMIMALAIILWLFLVPSPDGMLSHLEYRILQHRCKIIDREI